MGDSIGEVCCRASTAKMVDLGVPLNTIWTWDEMEPDEGRAPIEAGARAVALHVLELAAPDSPILEAMRNGATFEDAAARFAAGLHSKETLEQAYRATLEHIANGVSEPAFVAAAALGGQFLVREPSRALDTPATQPAADPHDSGR